MILRLKIIWFKDLAWLWLLLRWFAAVCFYDACKIRVSGESSGLFSCASESAGFGWFLELGSRLENGFRWGNCEIFSGTFCINRKLSWSTARFATVNVWVIIARLRLPKVPRAALKWIFLKLQKKFSFQNFQIFRKKSWKTKMLIWRSQTKTHKALANQRTTHNARSAVAPRRHHFVRRTDGLPWLLLLHLSQNRATLNHRKQGKTNYQKVSAYLKKNSLFSFFHWNFKTKNHRQSSMPSNGITKFWTQKFED